MPEQLKNDAITTLDGAISNTDLVITVTDAPGSAYGRLSNTGTYTARIWEGGTDDQPTSVELVRVQSVTGNDLTVLRGQVGTTAVAFGDNAKIAQVLDAKSLEQYVLDNAGGGGGGAGLSGLNSGELVYATSGTTVDGAANLIWKEDTTRLGIGPGATTPQATLHVAGTAQAPLLVERTDQGQAQIQMRANGWATFHSVAFSGVHGGASGATGQVVEGQTVMAFNAAAYNDAAAAVAVAGFDLVARGDVTTTSRPGAIIFKTAQSGSTTNTPRLVIDHNGNVVVGAVKDYANDFGSSAITVTDHDNTLATTATSGFLWIPKCDGTPTGVPTDAPVGCVALTYNAALHKLYVYDGGWKTYSGVLS